MVKRLSVFYISLCLVAIFGMGVWIGRLLPASPVNVTVDVSDEIEVNVTTPADDRIVTRATRRAFRRYNARLNFTQDQQEAVRSLFEAVGLQMAVLPKRSKARLEVLREFHKEIRPFLSEDQQEELDNIRNEVETRPRN